MKTLILVVLAAVAFSVASISALGRVATCSPDEGDTISYNPPASRSCSSTISTPRLRVGEKLTTHTGGIFKFSTVHLSECRQSAANGVTLTQDKIHPQAGVAIIHLAGTTWCRRKPDDKKSYLKIGQTIKIVPTGTIIGMTTTSKGSTVKVAEGAVVVSSKASHPIRVPTLFQLFIAPSGAAGKPAKLQLTPDDALAVAELQLDVDESGAKQAGEYLRLRKQSSTVVIAQDDATASKVSSQLGKIQSSFVSAPELLSNPQQGSVQIQQLATKFRTFVTVGTFAAMQPVWALIRSSKVPPQQAIVFVHTS